MAQTSLQFADVRDSDIRECDVAGDQIVEIITAARTLNAKDSGKIFGIATDAIVITLPLAVVGMNFTFVNTGADGANIITISPNSADGMWGVITLAGTVVDLGGVANKDLINTKATSIKGSSAKIVCMALTAWSVVSSTGIWAAQA